MKSKRFNPITKLSRIHDSNHSPEPGPGIDASHYVLLCEIHDRAIARLLLERLNDCGIEANAKHRRTISTVSVPRSQLSRSIQIQLEFQKKYPDRLQRRFSREYDAVFLISPLTLLGIVLTLLAPAAPRNGWAVVLFIGIVASVYSVWVYRKRRSQSEYTDDQFTIGGILWFTALIALILGVCRILL